MTEASVHSSQRNGPDIWATGRLGTLEVRNRFVLTGHGTAMLKDGEPTDALLAYYEERARGGVGLIMLGTQQVHPTSPGIGHLLRNYDDTIIPTLRSIASAARPHGTRVFGYIGHFGAQARTWPHPPWSASAIYDEGRGEYCHAMTEEEMAVIVSAHADAAARNIEAGLDGIEVHGGHGLLLHQFLSPWTNKREDQYGGSVENRTRFPAAVIRAVRERIGPNVPLGMRLSGVEGVDGGLSLDDMLAIVPRLVAAGSLDYVDVSAGNDRHAISNMLHHPPMGLPLRPYAQVAKAIRAAIAVPVIHGTRVSSAAVGQAMLDDGEADFVGMCRALIADARLPIKWREGRADEIVPCIACEQACIGHLERGQPISCIGNPTTGREITWGLLVPATAPQRVVVVGAGPAGMEAAWLAAARGHDVIVMEREAEAGGLLRLAAEAPGRHEWRTLIDHKVRRMAAGDVDIRYRTEATPEAVLACQPDVVVVATGSRAGVETLPGADRVFSHRDILRGAAVGGSVLVIDRTNRQQGVSTALFLAERGRKVTIVTAGARVGHLLEVPNFTRAQQMFALHGVQAVTDTEVLAVGAQDVVGRNVYAGIETRIGAFDAIVIVTAGTPADELACTLDGKVATIHLVGDCVAPRDVEAAILEGHRVGRAI